MIVPVEILKCVGFVGGLWDSEPEVKGTCFFVVRGSNRIRNWGWIYAVTARHVIDGIAHKGGAVMLRLNTSPDGAEWVPCPKPWSVHSDDSIDVAITPFSIEPPMDHKCFPIDQRVGHPNVSHIWNPDVGDELFFPGLFAPHYGRQRNEPIVRTGHIAAMPKEKIAVRLAPDKIRDIDAHLIEARSIGGFSGSPVFYYTGNALRSGGTMMSGARYFLMGLMHGHYDVRDLGTDHVSLDEARINMGIGIVVPVQKIIDTLEEQFSDTEFFDEERELERLAAQSGGTTSE